MIHLPAWVGLTLDSSAELAEQCFVTGGDTVFVHVAKALVLVPQLSAESLSAQARKKMREQVISASPSCL